MRAGLLAGLACSVLLLCGAEANAQLYELIKTCKRTWRAALVCIVVEKGVEKAVEKSIEEWLTDWRSGKGQKVPATPPPAAAPGVDYRLLMRDLDSKIGKAPLKDKTLVDTLGRSCLNTRSFACNEFRPLFKGTATTECSHIMTSLRCNMNASCAWQGAPSSTKNVQLPAGFCAPKMR